AVALGFSLSISGLAVTLGVGFAVAWFAVPFLTVLLLAGGFVSLSVVFSVGLAVALILAVPFAVLAIALAVLTVAALAVALIPVLVFGFGDLPGQLSGGVSDLALLVGGFLGISVAFGFVLDDLLFANQNLDALDVFADSLLLVFQPLAAVFAQEQFQQLDQVLMDFALLR